MKYRSPAPSRIVKPGAMPSILPDTIVQVPEGPAFVSGPLASRSTDHGSRPRRLVNQLESGTSSIVLTLSARMSDFSPAPRNEFSAKSYNWLRSDGRTPLAFSVSGSLAIGSSRRNFGPFASPLDTTAETATAARNRLRMFIL